VTTAISDLNSRVLQLQSGTIPSSQPEELSNYYDDAYDENSNWRDIDPDAEYTPIISDADRRAEAMEHIFIDLHGKLVNSKVIETGGPDGHDHFADLMARCYRPYRMGRLC
jgi:hypothetical protein